jgi:ATP-dependent DNA helicase RecG
MSGITDCSAAELLQQLNDLGEHERIEAKRATAIGHSIMETVCAFANEPHLGGGWLLLGVREEENTLFPTYEVDGLGDADKIGNDLLSQCRSVFNQPISPRIYPVEIVQGLRVMRVWIPESSPAAKPVYFKDEGLPSGALRRIGASDVRCSEDDLVVLFDGRNIETFDSVVLSHATMDDLDADAIEDYRRDRAKANPDAEELSWSDEELLQALNCVRLENGQWQPTVGGVLLFGSKIALRRLFPLMRIDYIRVPGKEWVPDPDSRFDSLELRDPLMKMVRRAQSAILDDMPEAFSLPEGQMQREVSRAIPDRVIREAVVNAVMHRSYRHHQPVQIIRYSNRLEIRNPGYSLKNEEHLGEPGSQTRNPEIAEVLHETRFAENKGSGIRVMRDLMKRANLTPPLFESDRAHDCFVATLHFHHFLSESDWQWLTAYQEFGLSNDEARALIWVRENGAIANAVYRNLNDVDTLHASKHLRRLCDAEVLELKGRSSAAYYVPGKRFVQFQEEKSAPLSGEFNSLSGELSPLSGELAALSGKLAASSDYPEPLAQKFGALPPDLQRRVLTFERRANQTVTRALLLELCAARAWRADELALLLHRAARYLQEGHLKPMIEAGLLERTHPQTPNHPQQAYRAPQGEVTP